MIQVTIPGIADGPAERIKLEIPIRCRPDAHAILQVSLDNQQVSLVLRDGEGVIRGRFKFDLELLGMMLGGLGQSSEQIFAQQLLRSGSHDTAYIAELAESFDRMRHIGDHRLATLLQAEIQRALNDYSSKKATGG